jgi:malate dehydrogenase (oxaloacetate-decarboxylating)(NADP+)
VLIMPALHTAHISSRLLQQLGGGAVIGPILLSLPKPVSASVSDMLNLAARPYDAIEHEPERISHAAE